jgi:hypothetical protein
MQMKRILLGFVLGAGLLAAGEALTIPTDATANANGTYSWTDKQGKKWTYINTPFGVSRTPDADQPQPKKAARPKSVPASAKLNPDGTYSYTDKSGAKWKYLVTPFGAIRQPADAGAVASQPAPADVTVKVIDKGDTVRFERPTPFGASVWEKKKSELNDDERRMVDSQTAQMPKAN